MTSTLFAAFLALWYLPACVCCCSVCAPGYGRSSPQEPCQPCGLGTYGSASRSNDTCKACPQGDRTFGYAWSSADVDKFTPEVTSPLAAVDVDGLLALTSPKLSMVPVLPGF